MGKLEGIQQQTERTHVKLQELGERIKVAKKNYSLIAADTITGLLGVVAGSSPSINATTGFLFSAYNAHKKTSWKAFFGVKARAILINELGIPTKQVLKLNISAHMPNLSNEKVESIVNGILWLKEMQMDKVFIAGIISGKLSGCLNMPAFIAGYAVADYAIKGNYLQTQNLFNR
jgi:hypothetical protein